MSYWSLHAYSTQSKKSVYEVIRKSADIFKLDDISAETLANSAGLSLSFEGGDIGETVGDIIKALGYEGKKTELCESAMISERMLRLYKTKTPTKQAAIALCVVLNKSLDEINQILKLYGYCLSDSIIGDVVVKWECGHHKYKGHKGHELLFKINETLEEMGVPLLMTRQR